MPAKTILLVDDDVDFLAIYTMALEAAGYAVIVAHDGAEAMAAMQQQLPDLVVLDVMMRTPEEGFELARALRRDERTRALPLVMLTSVNAVNEAQGHPLRLRDTDRDDWWLPVDRFLDKPIKPERLISVVREIVGS